jgi:hypothetical protein
LHQGTSVFDGPFGGAVERNMRAGGYIPSFLRTQLLRNGRFRRDAETRFWRDSAWSCSRRFLARQRTSAAALLGGLPVAGTEDVTPSRTPAGLKSCSCRWTTRTRTCGRTRPSSRTNGRCWPPRGPTGVLSPRRLAEGRAASRAVGFSAPVLAVRRVGRGASRFSRLRPSTSSGKLAIRHSAKVSS